MSYLVKSLAFSFTVLLRIYSKDDVFAKIYIPTPGFGPIRPLNEIQVGLVFVRDYDSNDQHTNGVFKPYWESSITPQLINKFKSDYARRGLKAKVYASIGGRDPKFSFKIKNGATQQWVSNAVSSLSNIVKTYNLDGIDIYYEYIDSTESQFVYAIKSLIQNLKSQRVINAASIAPSDRVNSFYVSLYKTVPELFDTVVYQTHNEVKNVPDPQTLSTSFKTKATKNYGADKLLAGYSAIYKDWDTVLPIVYFLGGLDILGINNLSPFGYSAVGTSIWFVAPVCVEPKLQLPTWMFDGMSNVTQVLTA